MSVVIQDTFPKRPRGSETTTALYTFNFNYFSPEDIQVHVYPTEKLSRSVVLPQVGYYTVRRLGAGATPGGTITILNMPATDQYMRDQLSIQYPAIDWSTYTYQYIGIKRIIPYSQPDSQPLSYSGSTVEGADDKLCLQNQQLNDRVSHIEGSGIFELAESSLTTNYIPKADQTGTASLIDSNITDDGTLVTVNSNTVFTGELQANLSVNIEQDLAVQGIVTIGTILLVSGNATIDGNLNVTQSTTLKTAEAERLKITENIGRMNLDGFNFKFQFTNIEEFDVIKIIPDTESGVWTFTNMKDLTGGGGDISGMPIDPPNNDGRYTVVVDPDIGQLKGGYLQDNFATTKTEATTTFLSTVRLEIQNNTPIKMNNIDFTPTFSNITSGQVVAIQDFNSLTSTATLKNVDLPTPDSGNLPIQDPDDIYRYTVITDGPAGRVKGGLLKDSPLGLYIESTVTFLSSIRVEIKDGTKIKMNNIDFTPNFTTIANNQVLKIANYDSLNQTCELVSGDFTAQNSPIEAPNDVDRYTKVVDGTSGTIKGAHLIDNLYGTEAATTAEEVFVSTTNLVIEDGSQITMNNLKITPNIVDPTNDQILKFTNVSTLAGTADLVNVDMPTGGSGGGTGDINVSQNFFPVAGSSNNLINSSLTQDQTNSEIETEYWLKSKRGLKIESILSTNNLAIIIPSSPNNSRILLIDINDSQLGIGDKAPLYIERASENVFRMFISETMAGSFIIREPFYNIAMLTWEGHTTDITDVYAIPNPVAKITGNEVTSLTFGDTVVVDNGSKSVSTTTPVSGVAQINTSVCVNKIIYTAPITSFSYTTPMTSGQEIILMLTPDVTVSAITWPTNWRWLGGVRPIATTFKVNSLFMMSLIFAGGVYVATVIKSTPDDVAANSLQLVGIPKQSSIAKWYDATGNYITYTPKGTIIENTTTELNFKNMQVLNHTKSSTTIIQNSSDLVIDITDTSDMVYQFVHDIDITNITFNIPDNLKFQMFSIKLVRITGASTQIEIPMPAGVKAPSYITTIGTSITVDFMDFLHTTSDDIFYIGKMGGN